jgi:surfactin family lipopeptide synthetase A
MVERINQAHCGTHAEWAGVPSDITTALPDDNFFARAHTSANRLRIPLLREDVYAGPPVGLSAPAIIQRPSAVLPPLSFAQQQVWLHAQFAPDIPLYNEIMVLERTGPLIREALERSFCEITRRHEMLRTTFPPVDGPPVQAIAQHQAVALPFTDLSNWPDQERKAVALQIAAEEARRPFDLAKGPLMRVRLLQLSQENYVLVLVLHAIVADEWSLNILARELGALYQAYATGEPSPLPDLPIQYVDYACWQRNWLKGDVLEQQIAYWRERLAGVPLVLDLPTNRPRPSIQQFRGGRQSLLLSKSLSESLKEMSKREGVTLFVTLLAAFQTLLSRYTGQDDIVAGSIVPGRDAVNTVGLIGLFAHTVMTRIDLGGDPTFRELLWRVRDVARSDYQNHSVPFDRLVSELQPQRDPSRNPIFQVLFSLTPSVSFDELGWTIANFEVDTGAAKVDLQLQLYDRPEEILARFTYNSDLFDDTTIVRMTEHFQTLLQSAVANPDQRVSRLPLLTAAERYQLLIEWNNTQADYLSDRCLHQLFEAQADRTPDATSVVFENQQLTYRELNRRANQLAHHLVELGVGPDVLVGICVERSVEMVVGLLGILKAGGAYVPLDPAYPRERLSFMLEDAGVSVLLTQDRLLTILPERITRVVALDSAWHEIAKQRTENPVSKTKPGNLAYVIYTSGSTGKPKGVQIPHRAVVNFLTSMSRKPGMTSGDRLLALTTLSFDIAALEIYLPLILGASVEIVSREVSSDGNQLLLKLRSARATVLQATPATWQMLLEAGWEGSPDLKILCGGEAVSRKLANQLLQRAGSVWNMYGPTETTIWSTTSKVEPRDGAVSIGRPIANTEIFILDKALQPVPVGVAGELHIGGDGLARGYLKRPELTAEKFIANPFSEDPEVRLYKTGDLARYLPNGEIEFLGRMDHQVKIRGFRIELGEIEAVLRQHSGVSETVVVPREDAPGDRRLAAYFVPAQGAAPSVGELRNFLKKSLPEYMVPSAIVSLREMPLTPNGKVNRKSLPPPEQPDLAPNENFNAPRDALESQLTKIWESVLAVRPIGIRHNFFELGGHSLVAVRLMHRIEQAFGKKLPAATLFQTPTIEQLAAILRQEGWSPRWSSLVAIQASGSKPPFFCVHGAGGTVIRFRDLARYLGPDQPVYGLQAPALNGKHLCPRVEDLAARYINEIHSVQAEGPYFLGGYSFGGIIAFEMAQQLTAQNQQVALVVLFDTFCTYQGQSRKTQAFAEELVCLFKGISSAVLRIWRMSAGQRRARISLEAKALMRAVRRRTQKSTLPRIVKEVFRANQQAAKDYTPRVYPGRVALFRSNYKMLTQFRDRHAGWNTYAPQGLKIYEIPGDHDSILLEPQVQLVAEQLRECLAHECVTFDLHSRM